MKIKRQFVGVLQVAVSAVLIIQLSGCGYILYPERRGQKPVGRIDPTVAVLDGLGLLLFIIPGVIAFAVDITNGTLYFPNGHRRSPASTKTERITAIRFNPAELNEKTIRRLVKNQTGISIEFDLKNMEICELDRSENIEAKLVELEKSGYLRN